MKDTVLDNQEDIKDYDNPIIEVDVKSFDYLIGKLFSQLELLGLPDRQAQAYRSSVRRMFWEWYNNHLPNPHGLSDPSLQGRRAQGLEPTHTSKLTSTYIPLIN